MKLETRAQGLLALVESDRDARCAAILAEARQRSRAMLGEARKKGHVATRAALLEARRQYEQRQDAARARLQTRRRMAAQARASALLAQAWQRLPTALQARWQDRAGRKAWVANVLAAAQQVLAPGTWGIACAADWPEPERREAATLAGAGVVLQIEDDPQITAGLRVRVGGTAIDGTLEGLLADRAEIGARLLFALEDRA